MIEIKPTSTVVGCEGNFYIAETIVSLIYIFILDPIISIILRPPMFLESPISISNLPKSWKCTSADLANTGRQFGQYQ